MGVPSDNSGEANDSHDPNWGNSDLCRIAGVEGAPAQIQLLLCDFLKKVARRDSDISTRVMVLKVMIWTPLGGFDFNSGGYEDLVAPSWNASHNAIHPFPRSKLH